MGSSYAIPTKDAKLAVLPLSQIEESVAEFVCYAHTMPDSRFWVTRIGCVLADTQTRKLHPCSVTLRNCSFAREWAPFLLEGIRENAKTRQA